MCSLPNTEALAAAWHTRPSVLSAQSAGLLALTRLQSSTISLARSRCCLNHCSIDSFEALETSPAPASWTFFTIGLGGSTFLQPPGITATKRPATSKLLSFTKLLHGASIFCRRSPCAVCQILADQQQRPPVPSEFAPPDRLVYSVSRLTSTGEEPSAARPAARQSGFLLRSLEPRHRHRSIAREARQEWPVGFVIVGRGIRPPLTSSVLCPETSGTISGNPGSSPEF